MAAEVCGTPPEKRLFLNFRVIESTCKKQVIEDLENCEANFCDGHAVSDTTIPMPDSLDLKSTIIENFIDYATTDDKERDLLKRTLSDYIDNDHVNELYFLDGQKARG